MQASAVTLLIGALAGSHGLDAGVQGGWTLGMLGAVLIAVALIWAVGKGRPVPQRQRIAPPPPRRRRH